MSQCRSCHAEIEWVVTERGKNMPIDAEPVEGGNLVFTGTIHHSVGRASYREVRYLRKGIQPSTLLGESEETYVSHFATCPNSEQHRAR